MWTHVFAALLVVHGLIHVLGFLKAYRLADLPQLTTAIGPGQGVLWLLAAGLFIGAAVGLYRWPRWWWAVALLAVAASVPVLVAAWRDAWAGGVVTIPIVLGIAIGAFVSGPTSLRAHYETDVAAILADRPPSSAILTDADLAPLPPPVQRYIRRSGAVGQPHVRTFRVLMHGQIRSGPDSPWMPFRVEQHSRVSPPARLFYMDAAMRGLPVQGLHRYVGEAATMRVEVAGLVPVAQMTGQQMTRAETVTLLNDLAIMAPGALVAPMIRWTPVDDRTARAAFAHAGHTVSAELLFDEAGDLVDFFSDDRLALAADGTSMTPMRWSTPIGAYRQFGRHRLASHGEGRWHAPDGDYAYIVLDIDDVQYNVADSATSN